MSINRQHYDAKTKTEVCDKVLSKELSFDKAIKQYGLQPYQLYAWLGQHAMQVARNRASGIGSDSGHDTGETGAHAMIGHAISVGHHDAPIDKELAQKIGEWIIKNRLSI